MGKKLIALRFVGRNAGVVAKPVRALMRAGSPVSRCVSFPSGEYIEMAHIGNFKHRVLAQRSDNFEPLWRAEKHPLYDFVVRTHHPDLEIL